ncbi:MAG: T9SS type A sorting domain-containing protein, partial [Ferruginibacter sp.]|nr:T9SS type A sorting domain-containing protein [Ferruginibacter sp.]
VDGINYYQIKQVDINGPVMLSYVVSVNKGKAISINVYPTVFTTNFKVDNGSNKKGMIQMYSADGKAVLQYPLSAGITVVNAAILAKGIYLYKIIIDGVVAATGRMIKE